MKTIKNWKIIYSTDDLNMISISGEIFGDPRFEDGSPIITSYVFDWTISKPQETNVPATVLIVTYSGSTYKLQDPMFNKIIIPIK